MFRRYQPDAMTYCGVLVPGPLWLRTSYLHLDYVSLKDIERLADSMARDLARAEKEGKATEDMRIALDAQMALLEFVREKTRQRRWEEADKAEETRRIERIVSQEYGGPDGIARKREYARWANAREYGARTDLYLHGADATIAMHRGGK